jgi:hypothetical protein
MPDFERIHRSLDLHFATPANRPILAAQFKGEDRARWQCVETLRAAACERFDHPHIQYRRRTRNLRQEYFREGSPRNSLAISQRLVYPERTTIQ